jgi:hypothetical protein
MKRYRLIKEYPGSPGLGDIAIQSNSLHLQNTYYINNKAIMNFPEKYPENWEEIIEKDYEILSLKDNFSHLIYQLKENGKYSAFTFGSLTLDNCLNYGNTIYSINRLSDGEIFTIGDEIYSTNWTCDNIDKKSDILTEISLNNEFMFKTKITWQCNLKDIQHYKEPLFTTEDGVDIFKSDKFFTTPKSLRSNNIQSFTGAYISIPDNNILSFSTKEKAEEYILLNKPCISINDLYAMGNWSFGGKIMNDMKALVKQKLNQ